LPPDCNNLQKKTKCEEKLKNLLGKKLMLAKKTFYYLGIAVTNVYKLQLEMKKKLSLLMLFFDAGILQRDK